MRYPRKMEEYARIHFTSEEIVMKRYGFPRYQEHKKGHKEFIKKVEEFKRKQGLGELTLTFVVLNFFKN